MRTSSRLLISAAAAVLLWTAFAWPLPRYFSSGIPAAAHPTASGAQVMIAGDHLQFLYHCWLFGDMLSGKTAFFHNLYEFNTGDDAERFSIDSYYFPFSLVYSLGAAVGGRAFGWNLMGLITIWLTLLGTWSLARRFTSNELASALAGLLAAALPYRWISLFGGSPTGLAMMWVPLIWLGTDMATREDSARGGWFAGLCVLFAACTDLHVFFFSVLALPLWCALALIGRTDWKESFSKKLGTLYRALLPIATFAVLAALLPNFMKWLTGRLSGLEPAANLVSARTFNELRLYSPGWQGFFSWRRDGRWGEIYIGWLVLPVMGAGALALLFRGTAEREKKWRSSLALLALIAGSLGIGALAMGAQCPGYALPIRLCRALIPPYQMIRQPAKIFCLMPSFLAVASAISFASLAELPRRRTWKTVLPLLCTIAMAAEYLPRINPLICILDKEQNAYAAVPSTAEREGESRAIVVPLWPGDSHYSSVYQHYASLYRIRLVNGYTPFVTRDYFDNIFRRFESVNIGSLSGEQLDALTAMGVSAIILHEDLFPEQVSPFPVGFTIRELINHQRLALIAQDGPVWAFKILQAGSPKKGALLNWNRFGSARRWEAEKCDLRGAEIMSDEAAGGGALVQLSEQGASLTTPVESLGSTQDMKWLFRARGSGSLLATQRGTAPFEPVLFQMENPDWAWFATPIEGLTNYSPASLELELREGTIELDMVLLATGEWTSPAPNEVLEVPATAFFHAGYINMESDSVTIEKKPHANVVVFYGPKLPLEKGRYEVELNYRAESEPGARLGWFNIRRHEREPEERNDIKAGGRAAAIFSQQESLPVSLELVFFRNVEMEIESVSFRRLP